VESLPRCRIRLPFLITGIAALFDEKSGSPKLIRRGKWGFGGKAPSCQKQGRLGTEPSDFQDFSMKIKQF